MTKEIRHKITLPATPAQVYAALMDESDKRSCQLSAVSSQLRADREWPGCREGSPPRLKDTKENKGESIGFAFAWCLGAFVVNAWRK
jgi:hypothetical protein